MKALKMEGQMDSWSDERLDELGRRVDDGFKTARKDLALVKTELKGDIAQLKGDLAGVEAGLEEDIAGVKDDLKGLKEAVAGCATKEELGDFKGDLNKRFDRLQFAMMVAGFTFGITTLGTLGGVLVKLA